jgi:hypothetical protein
MPVKFFPDKPIHLLEKFITNSDGTPLHGEIDVYRKLHDELSRSKDDWYVWHDLKLPRHGEYFNDYNKTSAQIDFLVLCKEGVLVLEIKGGAVSFYENTFYYGKDFNEPMSQDPFRQAEGYKHTLKDKVLNNLGRCFFCHAVVFPHVNYSFSSRILDDNLLWTKYKASEYKSSMENFIKSTFEYTKNLHKKHHRTYPTLEIKEIETFKKVLSPIVRDSSKHDNINTLEWLQVDNLEILEGLYKNKRIMIEGPPGSGKTTIAKAFIDQQLGKKGLYLCWNNLLMNYTKELIKDRQGIENIEVNTLVRFILKLEPSLKVDTLLNASEEQFHEIVKKTLAGLLIANTIPHYDYVVIDEGQDIFDRGCDLIINELCGYSRSGLKNGNSLVLYDIDQSYVASGRNVIEISDLLSEYFSHFKLNEVKRSAQCPDIKKFNSLVFSNPSIAFDYTKNEICSNIIISHHSTLEGVKKYIVNNFLSQMRNDRSSLRGGSCVLLVESTLMKESYKNEPGIPYYLTIKDVEEINESNVADKGNKLRYTSILKYKGLEKENVFLVMTKPSEKNKYELYVGATRAINNLEILIVD